MSTLFLQVFFKKLQIAASGQKIEPSRDGHGRPGSPFQGELAVLRTRLYYIIYIIEAEEAPDHDPDVNIGNTHITIAGYEHDTLQFSGRLHSDAAATIDEYAIDLLNLLSLYCVQTERIEGGILGSVVPALTGRVLAALRMLCSARFLTVGPGLKSGIKLRLDNPAQLGAELLCGAVAALARRPARWPSSPPTQPSPSWP